LPADLSDPLFNSREPAGDWEMVIKHGGHAMGLLRMWWPMASRWSTRARIRRVR
jgi:hypothetical protein